MINENLLDSARVSNSSHLSIVKVRIFALSPLAWTWTTTHVPLSIGKVFSFFHLIARSFMWISKHLLSLLLWAFPTQWSFSSHCTIFSFSFFLLSLVGSKWDCGANTLHDLLNDTFLAEMDIKGASRSGSIAPHLLDLFNETDARIGPFSAHSASRTGTLSVFFTVKMLFQFRN